MGKTHLHQITLIYGTFVGYCIINCVFVLTRLLRDRLTIRTSMTFTAIATILFSINGILLFTDKKELTRHSFFYPHLHLIEMLTVSASFSLLNGLLYLIDTVLTYKYAPDVEWDVSLNSLMFKFTKKKKKLFWYASPSKSFVLSKVHQFLINENIEDYNFLFLILLTSILVMIFISFFSM